MTVRAMRLRLGLFVVVAVVLLCTMIVMFGSLPTFFKQSTNYIVRFIDAPGLAPGAPVRRSGVRIGTVEQLILDEERGIVRVKVGIDEPYRIRRSEQPTLVVGLLGGDASIDFVPRQPEEGGPVDREPIEPGAELVGVRAATVNTLLKGASEVVPTTQETLNDIRKSLQRIDRLAARYEKMSPLVEETMREYRDLARAARAQIPELQRTNAEFRELGRAGREAVPDVQRASEEVRMLARDVRTALPEVMKTNKEAQEFMRSARELMPEIERTAGEYRELAGEIRKNIPAVRSTVDDVGAAARNATRLLERADVMLQENRALIEETLRNLNKTTQQAMKLLSNENIRNASEMVANARTASEPLPRISRNADAILEQLRPMIPRLNNTLTQFEAAMKDLQAITGPLGRRSERMSKNADESLAQLNLLLGDMRGLMQAIDRSNGTFKKILTDPSLYNNIDCAAAMVTRMMPRLEQILKDFEVFSDKLARHPESIGLGGAIRPSNGLKTPPTPPLAPKDGTLFIPPPH